MQDHSAEMNKRSGELTGTPERLSATLGYLEREGTRYDAASKSFYTCKAYRIDWDDFHAWCALYGHVPRREVNRHGERGAVTVAVSGDRRPH